MQIDEALMARVVGFDGRAHGPDRNAATVGPWGGCGLIGVDQHAAAQDLGPTAGIVSIHPASVAGGCNAG